jgi:hypothetical protein
MNIQELEKEKTELINDLIAVITIMEDLWRFHPENPNSEDVVAEYAQLLKIKSDLENEIDGLEI